MTVSRPHRDRITPGGPGEPVVLDGGDRRCIQLLIELRHLVDTLAAGRIVHLIAADPAAPIDLPAWCHLTGHRYLGPVPGERPTYAIETAAGARTTRTDRPWHAAEQ
ncbi:tRNA 2-thiouridine synthesizing protein A [Sinosporangium album]|uniref:tRNA 2-thiouridine synthesizing protein A n=1 Tax=Sinosporangium album TaxID=504805 RepID=A0A1G8DIW3_9ACTN|nr:sulfurtransferase tusA [Sinosporangium album]SDH57310.1 tRNA 2-thiouridine synthesizing protein A [Sinosporangium album]